MLAFYIFRWSANNKLLECEASTLRLSMVQLAGFKTLAALLSCSRYSDLLYTTTCGSSQAKEGVVINLLELLRLFHKWKFVLIILFLG